MDNRVLAIISAVCILGSGGILFTSGKRYQAGLDASVLPVAKAKPLYGKASGYPLVRCKGITRKGVQCRRQGYWPTPYCWQHQPLPKGR